MTLFLLYLLTASTIAADPLVLRTIDNQVIQLDSEKVKATAFIFVTDVCPIANAYQPRLAELHKEYAAQGIQFVEVYPLASITREGVLKHRQEFDIRIPSVIDNDRAIAKRLGAKVTPEAIVLDRQGQTLYRGRIDDQHAALGKKRPQPTRHDLSDALKAIVSGQPIEVPETQAVGCFIR